MNLQRIWADPVSFPWSNIWIISTHPGPRTKSRSIKSSTRWSANNTPPSNIRGRRLSISTSVPPATNFTAAWSTTSMIKTGSMAMICIPTPHRRCRTCTSSISWRGQKKKRSQWNFMDKQTPKKNNKWTHMYSWWLKISKPKKLSTTQSN